MKPLVSAEISKKRIANWISQAKPVDLNPTWIERRQAIQIGDHLYLVTNGQVFQCAHCGNYDPKWDAIEVLAFFEETYGIKPIDIEITCSVAENIDE